VLPTRRHRKWRVDARWGGLLSQNHDTMTREQVPMTNALAVEILAAVALSLEIHHAGTDWPSMGYRLGGEETPAP